MRTQEEPREIVHRIVAGVNPKRIILFGAHRGGTAGDYADVAALVMADVEGGGPQRTWQVWRHLRGVGVPMGGLVYRRQEYER